MNEEAHWNKIGNNYSEEIFDVFKSDKKKVLPRYFKKHAHKAHKAIDFGCGIGKAFPYLAPVFKEVLAIDISAELLAQAKQAPYTNIAFKRADLSRKITLPPADFAFCCNVVMLPEREKNMVMFGNIARALRPGGTAMIVVPSLDSVLFSALRLIDWYKTEGVAPKDVPAEELHYFKNTREGLLQGVILIDGVPTKHYSAPEIEVVFASVGLTVTALEKIEYDWTTEFSSPPKWMKEPFPWDWLIEVKKK